MTNFERLLDLPLREVLKEFGNPNIVEAAQGFSFFMNCCDPVGACSICGDVERGSCAVVCESWFNSESDPDANYNEDVWHDAAEEDPPTSVTTIEYIVLICGASEPTQLIWDGDHWLDSYANHYNVKYWRPMPKLPEEVMKNAD